MHSGGSCNFMVKKTLNDVNFGKSRRPEACRRSNNGTVNFRTNKLMHYIIEDKGLFSTQCMALSFLSR